MNVQFEPRPDRLDAALEGFQVSAALRSGLEIDLFTAIGEGHQSAEALATRCSVHPRGVRILADYLAINGFLTKHDNVYQLTREAKRFLDRRSPDFACKTIHPMHDALYWTQVGRLTQCVRQGGAVIEDSILNPDHEVWVLYARIMGEEMAEVARATMTVVKGLIKPHVRPPLKILDIAAGHGMFGIAFAKGDPTCQIVAQDWPLVLEIARENAVAHGVADRVTLLPGDIRQVDIGGGYDVVLIPNLIHYLDRASSVQVFKKVRAALKPAGVVAIAEFAPNDDRISPPWAGFALYTLLMSRGGDAYTVNEILSMCFEAGFTRYVFCDVPLQRVIAVWNE
jgi:2-polyprenyl-3-methyl-5-hydroxy-6-metoxy-1,4-benzoquinol methylase